jgi:hypothetical protein
VDPRYFEDTDRLLIPLCSLSKVLKGPLNAFYSPSDRHDCDNQYVSSEQFSDYLTLLINSIEIDMDLFRILKYIEGSGKEWLL